MNETRKVSELIRDGAKLRPQAFGKYFDIIDGVIGDNFCSCVLGAIAETIIRANYDLMIPPPGHLPLKDELVRTALEVPIKMFGSKKFGRCPIEDCDFTPPDAAANNPLAFMVHLNDDHKLSREQIADWLESEGY